MSDFVDVLGGKGKRVSAQLFRQDVSKAEEASAQTTDALWRTAVPSLLYLTIAFLFLVQWRAKEPWSRIDVFSGSYLALRSLGVAHSIIFSRGAFRSKQARREWWGETSDPGGIKWVVLLMLGDLTVFLDYGHWHLLRVLEHPALQGLGVGLYAGVAAWQIWTDTYLTRYFDEERPAQAVLDRGPFRYVRHPRYAGAMLGKVAFAMALASLLGWFLAIAWAFELLRKIRVEEARLHRLFGREYEAYSQRTRRLVPGIF